MNLEQFLMIKRANTGQVIRTAERLFPSAQKAVNTFNPESIRRWSDALAKAGPYTVPKSLPVPQVPRVRPMRRSFVSGIQTANPGEQVFVPNGSKVTTLWGPGPKNISAVQGVGATPLGYNYFW